MGTDDKSSEDTGDVLKQVITGLMGAFTNETIAEYDKVKDLPDVVELADLASKNNIAIFNHKLEQMDSYREGMLSFMAFSEYRRFLYLNLNYVESHFGYWIKEVEGHPCYYDKVRAIVRRLDAKLRGDDDPVPVSYAMTTRVFLDIDEVMAFFKSICKLHHGDPREFYIVSVRYARILTVKNHDSKQPTV